MTATLLEDAIGGPITASGGWTIAQADRRRPLAELISDADAAMYASKRAKNVRPPSMTL